MVGCSTGCHRFDALGRQEAAAAFAGASVVAVHGVVDAPVPGFPPHVRQGFLGDAAQFLGVLDRKLPGLQVGQNLGRQPQQREPPEDMRLGAADPLGNVSLRIDEQLERLDRCLRSGSCCSSSHVHVPRMVLGALTVTGPSVAKALQRAP